MIYLSIYLLGIPICLFGVYFIIFTHKSSAYINWNDYCLTHFSALLFAIFWPIILILISVIKLILEIKRDDFESVYKTLKEIESLIGEEPMEFKDVSYGNLVQDGRRRYEFEGYITGPSINGSVGNVTNDNQHGLYFFSNKLHPSISTEIKWRVIMEEIIDE